MKKLFNIILTLGLSSKLFAQPVDDTKGTIQIFLMVLILLVVIFFVIIQFRKKEIKSSSLIENQLQEQISKNDQMIGKNQELTAQISRAQNQIEERDRKITDLEKRNTHLESELEKNRNQLSDGIKDLEKTRVSLEDEKKRLKEEEISKRQEYEDNFSRIWKMHEETAINFMHEVCRKRDIALQSYDNKNLPEDFDSSFKPDFVVKVLNQYVIFDPKTSKNINTYLKEQSESTSKKIKKSTVSEKIYNTVYFVVPSIALTELKNTYNYENGYSFITIPLEAFEPIVRIFKRLEDYDLADKYDLQERENIINFISLLNYYINKQNATLILSTLEGIRVLAESENMSIDVQQEIANKIKNMRISPITKSQLQKLMNDTDLQIEEIKRIIQPQKSKIDQDKVFEHSDEEK